MNMEKHSQQPPLNRSKSPQLVFLYLHQRPWYSDSIFEDIDDYLSTCDLWLKVMAHINFLTQVDAVINDAVYLQIGSGHAETLHHFPYDKKNLGQKKIPMSFFSSLGQKRYRCYLNSK